MKSSVRIARIAGIEIGVHWSVLVIGALLAWSIGTVVLPELAPGESSVSYWLAALIVTTTFFASLVAHEMGHALTARREGIEVKGITLWLLGGTSFLASEAETPQDELRLAVAGPATSLLLGVVAIAVAMVSEALSITPLVTAAAVWLGVINIVLALFNLVPAFPLDGGRVLRALIWRRTGDPLVATAQAARAGTAFGYGMVALGFVWLLGGVALSGMWFVLLGLFLVNASRAQAVAATEERLLGGVTVAEIMTPDPESVRDDITITEFVERYVLGSRHSAYPVVGDDHRPFGLIALEQVRAVPMAERASTSVARAAQALDKVVAVGPGDSATDALHRIGAAGARRALVIDAGHLVGLLSLSDVARAVETRALARGLST